MGEARLLQPDMTSVEQAKKDVQTVHTTDQSINKNQFPDVGPSSCIGSLAPPSTCISSTSVLSAASNLAEMQHSEQTLSESHLTPSLLQAEALLQPVIPEEDAQITLKQDTSNKDKATVASIAGAAPAADSPGDADVSGQEATTESIAASVTQA